MGLTTKTALKPEASPLEIYSDKLVQKKKIQDIRMFSIIQNNNKKKKWKQQPVTKYVTST